MLVLGVIRRSDSNLGQSIQRLTFTPLYSPIFLALPFTVCVQACVSVCVREAVGEWGYVCCQGLTCSLRMSQGTKSGRSRKTLSLSEEGKIK